MAGALDLKRETIRIRRQQEERNRIAREELNNRLQRLDDLRLQSEGDRRKALLAGTLDRNVGKGATIDEPNGPESGLGSSETNDRDSTLDPLQGVSFASSEAEEMARREKLTAEDFEDYEPSKKSGYSIGDVRTVVADMIEDESEEEEEEEDEGEDDSDDDEEGEDEEDEEEED